MLCIIIVPWTLFIVMSWQVKIPFGKKAKTGDTVADFLMKHPGPVKTNQGWIAWLWRTKKSRVTTLTLHLFLL